MSRIGRKPIIIPKDVKIEIGQEDVSVQGPKGILKQKVPQGIALESKDGQIFVKRSVDDKVIRALHGLVRMLIFNMIKGVTEGYSKELEIVGVGFRAGVQGNNLTLQLGFSHPVNFPIPEGIKIETPKQTQIVIRGIDKEMVGEVAARIRAIFPPEPYKGKGIRYLNEFVRKKVGKAVTK
jgi:large subunit ribosomal protein L6